MSRSGMDLIAADPDGRRWLTVILGAMAAMLVAAILWSVISPPADPPGPVIDCPGTYVSTPERATCTVEPAIGRRP